MNPETITHALSLFTTIHVVGFVSWFAGMFYLVRIFVYQAEAEQKTDNERAVLVPQYRLMQSRVYKIIMNPAMMLTFTAGFTMIGLHEYLHASLGMEGAWIKGQGWLHLKLTLLVFLLAYHIYCKKVMKRLAEGRVAFSSMQFRLLNEVPTIFLIFIAALGVYKNSLHYGYALLTIFGIIGLLFLGVKLYKRARAKNPKA